VSWLPGGVSVRYVPSVLTANPFRGEKGRVLTNQTDTPGREMSKASIYIVIVPSGPLPCRVVRLSW